MESLKPLNEKLIFFNINEIGYMTSAKGQYFSYKEELIYSGLDNDSIIRCQNKLYPLKNLGSYYENIFITYIPAKELDYYPNYPINDNIFQSVSKSPLIKISNEKKNEDDIKCYLSGKRSSIIVNDINQAIRLKGCGNLFLGFNLANVDDLGLNHLEIRGAQFKNTCLREQHITNLVHKECEKRHLISGNIPFGFYKYESVPSPLVNEAELCDKYCGLFLTQGDKRFGSNFFNGLNIILETLLQDQEYCEAMSTTNLCNFKLISEKLPNNNFKFNESSRDYTIEFNENILDNPLLNKNNITYKKFLFDYLEYEIQNLENSKKQNDKLITLENLLLKKIIEMKYQTNNNIVTKKLLLILIDKIVSLLKSKCITLFTLIIIVLSKMSYEIGYIKKMFEEMDLNWGTFDYHCNAHLDNLIVLPKNSNNLYLAPLDFDLSFTRDEFVDINYKNAKGIENNIDFDGLLEREKNNLVIQLIGINPIPNIEVKLLDFEKIFQMNSQYKLLNENLSTLLKENMVEYYSKGYLKLFETDQLSIDFNEYYDIGQELVKLVLYMEIIG